MQLDTVAVAEHVARLKAAKGERSAFEGAMAHLVTDSRLRTAEVIAIAKGYVGGIGEIVSRPIALAAIRHNFVELERARRKGEAPAAVRAW